MYKLILFLITSILNVSTLQAQKRIAFVANYSQICFNDSNYIVERFDQLPVALDSFAAIFIFSGSSGQFGAQHYEAIEKFLLQGKGIYIGLENWPLQSEGNLLTNRYFQKESWGDFSQDYAVVTEKNAVIKAEVIPSGTTTVAFPLDFRLQVLAWVSDEPLISAGEILGGKIIIDGGYSRFYCGFENENRQEILLQLLTYLLSKS